MPLALRITLIIGSVLYLGVIAFLLKRKKLNVQYSIIWLASAVVFLLIACFPVLAAMLSTVFSIEMTVNLIFAIVFAFLILLVLSLSIIVTGFAAKIKQLVQHAALLEERVRKLENASDNSAFSAEGEKRIP
jgi:hypothetical protein